MLFVYEALVITGLVSPLYHAFARQSVAENNGAADIAAAADAPENIERYHSTLQRLLSVILNPFVGFLLFALAMAMRKVLVFDLVYAESLGTVLATLLVLPLCFRRSEKPLLPFIYQLFLPLFAGALILFNSFPAGSFVHETAFIGSYVFFCVIGLLALAPFCAAANAREFPVALILGISLGAFCAVSWIGLRLDNIPLISGHYEEVLLVLSTLYFVYLLLAPGLSAWRTIFAPSEQPASRSLHEDLESRCDTVATAGALSKRESEIMLFMGRGYSPAYIAKKLFLSDSTVRTHIKSIYRKLGIHSREDLLQLIDS